MNISPLRKLLKDKSDLNPFNDKFEKETYLKAIFKKLDINQVVNDPLDDLVQLLPFLNDNFKEYYLAIKENIFNSNVSFNVLVDLLFTIFNRNFFIATKQMRDERKKDIVIIQKRSFSYKIESNDKSIGKIEVAAALESDIDALTLVVNFLRYFEEDQIAITENKHELHPISISKEILLRSNYFNIIKNIYDESIWNFGYWKLHESYPKPRINVVYDDTELLILNKVGLLRLQRNISSNFFFAANEIERNTPYGIFISSESKKNCKEKRIKKVSIKNGFINFQLAKGFGTKEVLTELKNTTAYITYYDFLDNLRFESFHNLFLSDILTLFSHLQGLLEEVERLDFDDSIFSINDIEKFPIKITHEVLMNYFLDRTTYTKPQILDFLGLISFKFGERINFWDRPLVRYKSFYYISFLPTLSPIILNLMDCWIEQGGYDLDIRGKYLEKYLKKEIEVILVKKGFYNIVMQRNKFHNRSNKFEEIDLLIIFKSIVLIAEVKCIKYPYEARDRHNSLNRLKQGVKQIKRKKDFIEINKDEIPEIVSLVNDKELVPIVITNFPTYSGYIIDGVPITDFYLLESYFKTGKMTDSKMQKGVKHETVKETFYYKTEDEMNKNFKDFFLDPYPIKEIKSLFQIVNQKVSLEIFNYDLFVTSAQIPDDYNLNLQPF